MAVEKATGGGVKGYEWWCQRLRVVAQESVGCDCMIAVKSSYDFF